MVVNGQVKKNTFKVYHFEPYQAPEQKGSATTTEADKKPAAAKGAKGEKKEAAPAKAAEEKVAAVETHPLESLEEDPIDEVNDDDSSNLSFVDNKQEQRFLSRRNLAGAIQKPGGKSILKLNPKPYADRNTNSPGDSETAPQSAAKSGRLGRDTANSVSRFSLYDQQTVGVSSARMSKRDPELNCETRDVQQKYPFAVSTDAFKPVPTRYLMSLRTKKDFGNIHKYHRDNTPDVILEKQRLSNPYTVNRELRAHTKGHFGQQRDVKTVLE